jgi:DNA-directed RNA polymerase subunit alpha
MVHPHIECMKTCEEHAHRHYGRFRIGPLLPGQSVTMGNGLRRILLSDLPGIAITSAQIEGVLHEFSTLDGVRESVLEILLNLKEVVLSPASPWEGPSTAYLHAKGPARITAGDLELDTSVKVVDPNQYLVSLEAGGSLEIKLTLDQGRGIRLQKTCIPQDASIGHTSEPNPDFDTLVIDAVFMPVTQVNYMVEAKGSHSEAFEFLTLEVWTNGSLSPRQAIHEGAIRMMELVEPLKDLTYVSALSGDGNRPALESTTDDARVGASTGDTAELISASGRSETGGLASSPETAGLLKLLIEELQLPPRPFNCLKRAQVYTIGDLLQYSREDLLKIKNFGHKSANEVVDALETRLHLSLPIQSSKRARKL